MSAPRSLSFLMIAPADTDPHYLDSSDDPYIFEADTSDSCMDSDDPEFALREYYRSVNR